MRPAQKDFLDVILTNKPKCFRHTSVFTTGVRDCHKLILSCLRTHFKRLPPKTFFCRDYKSFNQENVLRESDEEIIKVTFHQTKEPFSVLSTFIRDFVGKNVPPKEKGIRGSNAILMNSELSKTIIDWFLMKNRFLKWPLRENILEVKRIKSLCKSLIKRPENLPNLRFIKRFDNQQTVLECSQAFFQTKIPNQTILLQ